MTLADNSRPHTPRITLIDTLRGIALLAMASYHFTWDLEFFGYIEPGTATTGWWRIYARAIASSFLFLAGVSLVLAHYPTIRWRSFWKRFAMVAGAAAAISIATLFAIPQEWIFFGILHSIAAASLLGLAFLRLPPLATGSAAALLVLAMIVDSYLAPGALRSHLFDPKVLSWIGFAATAPRSNDFVPLFPWLAALLAGVAVARLAVDRAWLLSLSRVQTRPNLLSRAGRHSLAIYLVHQPVLIALVYVLSQVSPPPQPDLRQSELNSCQADCTFQGNEVGFCTRFCICTVDELAAQSLLEPLRAGAIDVQTDNRVRIVAEECSIRSR